MSEAHFGRTGPVPPPGTGTPDAIRAILAGISNTAPAAPTLTVLRPDDEAPAQPTAGAPQPGDEPLLEDPGALSLASVDVVLPHILESAHAAGRSLSVVVARPGPAATPGVRVAPASAGTVADLAAALAVSLGPEQDLLSHGPGHLVVTMLGGSPRREATALMQRAAEAGAPMFTWAAARYPNEAQSATGLLDLARARVDGTEPVAERRSRAAAVWAGVAAAALVAAFAFIVNGHGSHHPTGQTGGQNGAAGGSAGGSPSLSGSGGSSGAANTGGSASGSSGHGSSGYGSSGYGSSGYGGPGGGSGTGVSGSGTSGGTASNGTGSGTDTGNGTTQTTLPSNTTGTTTGNTTGTSTVTTTANNPTTTVPATTTTTVCSTNLLGQLVCTVGGLLGGH